MNRLTRRGTIALLTGGLVAAGAVGGVAAGLLWYGQRPKPVTISFEAPREVTSSYHFAREANPDSVPLLWLSTPESLEVLAAPGAVTNVAGHINPIPTSPSPYTSAALKVPAGSSLTFATLALRPFDARSTGPVTFRIEAELADGTQQLLHESRMTPRRIGEPAAWRSASVALNSIAGETVRFVFSNEPYARLGGSKGARAIWGNPVLQAPSNPAELPPNVVLVSIDTLRPDVLQCYGYARESSPYLTRFAEGAHVFDQCMSPSSWTLPAHASLMTGLHPSQHGAISFGGGSLPESITTLGEIASAAGYRTAAYTNGGYVDFELGFGRGFERYTKYGPADTGTSIGDASNWIATLKGAPFFVFLHTYLMHEPYEPRPEHLAAIADPGYASALGDSFAYDDQAFVENLNEADRRHVESLYTAQLPEIDAMMELFFNRLKKAGVWDNALVIVFSDHGEEFWEHGSVDHGVTLYDEQLWVPLIVKLPHQSEGSRVPDLVDLTDVFATVAAHVTQDPPSDRQSRDLTPLMTGASAEPGRAFLISEVGYRENAWGLIPFDPVRIAVRTPEYKLVDNSEGHPVEFYDLRADPGERINRAAEAGAPMEELNRLLEQYKSMQGGDESLWSEPLDAAAFEDLKPELEALGYL